MREEHRWLQAQSKEEGGGLAPRKAAAGVQRRGWTGLPATARSGKKSASGRAAGRLRGEGTKRGRPESCAVPARRGRVTASLACQAARRQAAEISQHHSPFRSQPPVPPPPRRALTQSGTPAAAGFARDATGLPHRHPRLAPEPAPGRRTPAPIGAPGGSAAGSGPEAQRLRCPLPFCGVMMIKVLPVEDCSLSSVRTLPGSAASWKCLRISSGCKS
ncbi:uncharacterized protein [Patagioenas fasciata]|uniref:uncharacterized protein n=1 Tax=Patagioenas fasciata TaxID=372321 RepID=UPI003A99E8F3